MPAAPCPILVVDDDDAIRSTVGEILELEGYPVALAANGAEALEVVRETPPAIVLLDMRMPVLDGWGFDNRLAQEGIRLPIVVMTVAQNARRWCDEIGGTDCLAKPFEFDELLDVVARVCAERGRGPLGAEG